MIKTKKIIKHVDTKCSKCGKRVVEDLELEVPIDYNDYNESNHIVGSYCVCKDCLEEK